MPVCSYWTRSDDTATSVTVRFHDSIILPGANTEFEVTETIDCVFVDGVYNQSLTSARIQERCVELEIENTTQT